MTKRNRSPDGKTQSESSQELLAMKRGDADAILYRRTDHEGPFC